LPTAKGFCCEQEQPGFERAGLSAMGARHGPPIRARTEKMALAGPPPAVEIPSDGSEADAQRHTGGSTRQGDRPPEPWHRGNVLSTVWALEPRATDELARWLSAWGRSLWARLLHRSNRAAAGLATFRPLVHADWITRAHKSGSRRSKRIRKENSGLELVGPLGIESGSRL
jgi:hypothetical protein